MNSDFLKNVTTYISDKCKQEHQRQLQQQNQTYLQTRNQNVFQIMSMLQKDLYECIGNRHYPKIINIASPSYIRICNYRIMNNTVIYQFELDKEIHADNYSDKIPPFILEKLLRNINLDKTQKQRELLNLYPVEYISISYPCLFAGFKVLSLRDIGVSIVMDVACNIQP